MNRKLRMGMVGGGRGGFIGQVHRMAANLDGKIELTAGAFSSDPEKSKLSGEDFFLDPDRVYGNYREMAEKEAAREDPVDFVSIVVQNSLHFEVAKTFLEAGFHVVCDKPMTQTYEEALELRKIVGSSDRVFALTHNYTGYPMVKEARRMVRDGELGRVLKVVVEYPQGYSAGDAGGETSGPIDNWRADPSMSGISNCMGDIGTHAHNLMRYITGLEVEEICSELSTFVPDRQLDDDGNNLVRLTDGARGILYASQISAGEENNLNIRVYGNKASLEWHQEDPNDLVVKYSDAPRRTYRRGNSYISEAAAGRGFTRTPFAHPEGFIEAFANIYLEVARAVGDRIEGNSAPVGDYDFPNVDDGVAGMAFVKAAVESSASGEKWLKFPGI